MGILNMKDRDGILGLLEMVMSRIHLPMLKAYDKWGQLSSSPQGQKTVDNFKDNMEGFVRYLNGMLAIYVCCFCLVYL